MCVYLHSYKLLTQLCERRQGLSLDLRLETFHHYRFVHSLQCNHTKFLSTHNPYDNLAICSFLFFLPSHQAPYLSNFFKNCVKYKELHITSFTHAVEINRVFPSISGNPTYCSRTQNSLDLAFPLGSVQTPVSVHRDTEFSKSELLCKTETAT